jgi:hypothetical protein
MHWSLHLLRDLTTASEEKRMGVYQAQWKTVYCAISQLFERRVCSGSRELGMEG